MRLPTASTLLLTFLPALISAANDQQVPIKEKAAGWLDKAKAYVSSATPDVPQPIDAGAAKVLQLKVEKVNIRNYERKLGPKLEGEEEWMIYLTGGNKSCFGRCEKADLAWNKSIPLLSAVQPIPGSTLRLGTVNCEVEAVLCTAWGAAVPSVWHFIFPKKVDSAVSQSQAPSPLREIFVNSSSVTAADFLSIPRLTRSRYLDTPEYTGALHPVDGALRQYGLLNIFGYVLWGFGSTPSWLFMIGISFFSRQMMARRAAQRPGLDGRPAAAAPAAGAGAGAGSGASPGAARGGAKKRR